MTCRAPQEERPLCPLAFGLMYLVIVAAVSCCSIEPPNELPPPATRPTFYVATDGDDAYNGLSPSYQGGSNGPFRTLNRAADVVKAGDTVRIRGGTYREASTWRANGTEANPITITNYNGEKAIISGNKHTIPPGKYGALLKVSGDWYLLSNLEIVYSSWYGLTVTGYHCTADNVYVHHNWASGITITGWYGLVQNCRAYNNSLINEYFRPHDGGWSTGITACRSPHYTVLRGNTAWDNWGQGISTYESYHITLEDNISYNNQQNFYVSDTKYALVQRNISYCTPGNMIQEYDTQNGILIGDETRNPPSSDNLVINNLVLGCERSISAGRNVLENCLIANNTFVNASPTAGSESFNVRLGEGTYKNARFLNNIILQEDGVEICRLAATGVTFGTNNWSRSPDSGCQGPGDIIGDPMLAKTGPTGPGLLLPQWFKILENSPAKDRATPLSEVTGDFFRTPRGSAPDIGAHEIPNQSMAWTGSGMTLGQTAPLVGAFRAAKIYRPVHF